MTPQDKARIKGGWGFGALTSVVSLIMTGSIIVEWIGNLVKNWKEEKVNKYYKNGPTKELHKTINEQMIQSSAYKNIDQNTHYHQIIYS